MGAVESIIGLYKVTMDLVVCYELKSEFADATSQTFISFILQILIVLLSTVETSKGRIGWNIA